MSVVIRLRRTGRKNRPCYRINVADTRFPRDGRMIETIGVYDPLRRDPAQQLVLDTERAKHWVALGAKPSEIVTTIFKRQGLIVAKPHVKRDRSGRGAKPTATAKRRETRDEAMAKKKAERRATRLKARRAAAKAAAAPAEAKS